MRPIKAEQVLVGEVGSELLAAVAMVVLMLVVLVLNIKPWQASNKWGKLSISSSTFGGSN